MTKSKVKVQKDEDFKEKLPDIRANVSEKVKFCFTFNTLKKCMPIFEWLPQYKQSYFFSDLVAGITVALTTIPQSIADAAIAGISAEYGLYSAFMGCFAYIIFGNSKDVTIGPTALVSLIMHVHISNNADLAILASFFSGLTILVVGILKMGVIVQFISMPVVTAFTTASAITIASSQINNLFGIQSPSSQFIPSWLNFVEYFEETLWRDAVLGVTTLTALILIRNLKSLPTQQYKAAIKYLSLLRNILAVIIGILLSYFLKEGNWLPFKVSGKITPGLPAIKLPEFSTKIDGKVLNFQDMISELGFSLIWTPLISVLECIAIIKTFSKGKTVDASQEMIALGFCNFFGSFCGSMPVTGSFTRTVINNSSGVRTQLGGVYTGIIVLMAIAFLTETFYYIPKATLAAIIISSMIPIIELRVIMNIWQGKKIDFILFLVTLLCSLFWNIEYGILLGTMANLIFVLWKSARPQIEFTIEKINCEGILLVTIKCYGLDYAAGEYVKDKIMKKRNQNEFIQKVVINGQNIKNIDCTIAKNIISMKNDLEINGCQLICWNWCKEAAGVICRMNHTAKGMFVNCENWEEIVTQYQISPSSLTLIETES